MTDQKDREIFGIHRTTLLVIAVAITFGSFSVYKALGIGRTERSEVPAVAAPVSGTRLAAGDFAGTNTNPLASATRLTNAPHAAVKTDLIPIEQIQVGDRVLAESPTGEEDTAFGSEIIPSDWRKLTLRAPKRDGTTAEVVLLRPLTWLNEQHGEVGGTVFISVPECGIDGNAQVLAIDSCPEIPSGAGRVVTGTFLHQARSTITLTIAGQSEPIECTGNHPFWSEDRLTFVRADSLQPNETLRTATGLTTVESWTPDLNPTPVYNIEVHGAHVYHVGTSGVVVHNPDPEDCIKWVQRMRDKIGGEAVHLTPGNGQPGVGVLPGGDPSRFRAGLLTNDKQHAIIVKDGMIFDNLNPNGIPAAEWFGEFMDKNKFPNFSDMLEWINFGELARGFTG
jgi:hypothetical protein